MPARKPQLLVVSFAPVAAEVLAGSLLGLVGSSQLFVVSFAPVAAVILTGDLLGLLLFGQGGALGVLEAGHGAGGLFEQVGPDGLFPVDQQYTVLAQVALAGGGDERRPFFDGLPL